MIHNKSVNKIININKIINFCKILWWTFYEYLSFVYGISFSITFNSMDRLGIYKIIEKNEC